MENPEIHNSTPGLWNNPMTRRRFLKRSGAVTASTLIAWHGLTTVSRATPTAGGSGLSSRPTKFILTVMIWRDNDAPPEPPLTEPTIQYVFEEGVAPYLEGPAIPATKPHPGMDPNNGRIRFQDEYLDTYVTGTKKDEGESYTVESGECRKDAPKVPKTYELTKTTYIAKKKRLGFTNYYQKGWLVTLEVTVTEWKH